MSTKLIFTNDVLDVCVGSMMSDKTHNIIVEMNSGELVLLFGIPTGSARSVKRSLTRKDGRIKIDERFLVRTEEQYLSQMLSDNELSIKEEIKGEIDMNISKINAKVSWFDNKSGEGMVKLDNGSLAYIHQSVVDELGELGELVEGQELIVGVIPDGHLNHVYKVFAK